MKRLAILMKTYLVASIIFLGLLFSCTKSNVKENTQFTGYGWLVPLDQLVIHEDNLDRIQSIDYPVYIKTSAISFNPNEEVLVFQSKNLVKIYPVNTIWSYEIVNDQYEDYFFTVSYCPITASGIAWNRELNNGVTTFGVSGSLYNSNLIPYDRNSGSFWTQMKLRSIKGPLGDDKLENEFLLHTIYSTAVSAYPEAVVLIDTSGNHECDSNCLSPSVKLSGKDDSAMFLDENYFGVISNDEALLFDYELFADSIHIIQAQFRSLALLIIGSKELGFITGFIHNGSEKFQPLNNQLPDIMVDSQGNTYDLMGNVTGGPKKGQRLKAPISYSAKKFAWELFFPDPVFY